MGGIKREIREYNFLVVLCQHLVDIISSHDAILRQQGVEPYAANNDDTPQ